MSSDEVPFSFLRRLYRFYRIVTDLHRGIRACALPVLHLHSRRLRNGTLIGSLLCIILLAHAPSLGFRTHIELDEFADPQPDNPSPAVLMNSSQWLQFPPPTIPIC